MRMRIITSRFCYRRSAIQPIAAAERRWRM
jgi:hypothetical protein